jgi:hypothetical protein
MEKTREIESFVDLTSLFDTEIKPGDKDKYDNELFLHLLGLKNMISNVEMFVDDEEKISSYMFDLLHDPEVFSAIPELFNNPKYMELNSRQKTFFIINMILSMRKSFNNIPRTGIFCQRRSIASDWYNDLLKFIYSISEEQGILMTVIANKVIVNYLLDYHKNKFSYDESKALIHSEPDILNQMRKYALEYIEHMG